MMSMYESLVNLLTNYCRQVGYPIQIEKSLQDSSEDDSNAVKIFVSKYKDLNSISMDSIAHDVVRKIHFAGTTKEDESPASVDSFLIDSNGFWYFIEFKNQKIGASKEKCIEKSYANVYWLLKILEELKNNDSFSFESFSSCPSGISPLNFVKEYCKFILVIADGKDDFEIYKIREARKAKKRWPDSDWAKYMKKLESYIYKSAEVYNVKQFDREFVKNFRYS